jgi:hypothetical protein
MSGLRVRRLGLSTKTETHSRIPFWPRPWTAITGFPGKGAGFLEKARMFVETGCRLRKLKRLARKPMTVRQTGRTTRMLEEAKDLAKAGRAVYVIAATWRHARALQRQVDNDMPNSSIKCEPPSASSFSWKTLSVLGAHPNCVFLVDHYAIEQEFALMLEMLTRYDQPAEGSQ